MKIKLNLRKILGVLTDLLSFGRSQGWWKQGQSIDTNSKDKLN